MNDAAMQQLSNRQDLQVLDLSSCGTIGDAACAHLRLLPRLRYLNLCETEVGDAGLAELAGLRSLRALAVGDKCTAKGLTPLRVLPNLQTLAIFQNSTGDEPINVLPQFPQLRFVNLYFAGCPDDRAKRLQKALPNATVYHPAVAGSEDERQSLRWLLDNKAVAWGWSGDVFCATYHEVPRGAFSVANVTMAESGPASGGANLRGLRCIDYLNWPNLKTADAEAEHIAMLTTLTELRLDNSDLSDRGIERLANLKQLEQLFLGGRQRFTDHGLEHLTTLEHLFRLSLYQTPVSDKGLAHVGRINGLQHLALDQCREPNVRRHQAPHTAPHPATSMPQCHPD